MDLVERRATHAQAYVPSPYTKELVSHVASRPQRRFRARERVIGCGFERFEPQVIIGGMLCRYTLTPDGRRQFNALLLPGDVIGIESVFNLRSADTVMALTAAVCQTVNPTDVFEAPLRQSIQAALERQTAQAGQWMLNLGARPAPQRLAYFFHETLTRMRALGNSDGPDHHLPLTQVELADFLALTPVHVNRCLAHLKSTGLVTFHRGHLQVHDPVQLAQFADSFGEVDS